MAKRNISQLRKPARSKDVTQSSNPLLSAFKFETKAQAGEEDEVRRKAIKKVANWSREARSSLGKRQLFRLRKRIKRRLTVASSRYMRKHRKRIINAVCDLAGRTQGDLIMVNLVSPSLRFPAGTLWEAEAEKILERLRQVLLRYGSASCDGWMIVFLDGEFEENNREFVIHFHGVGTQDFDAVFENARKKSRLFRRVGQTADANVNTPIRVIRKLENLPRLVGYCVMAFWPQRNRAASAEGDKPIDRRKRRVDEPQHSEYLLWLDRYQIQHICLMIGLEVDRHGSLKQTR
ncbi:hypothetical protein [Erythrobacter sp. THAF29]|uniref:hypothetical protein n=1 Tax=Erythrobacter sp. THAF29 TaxID=2587851 RepID=UPI001268519A|nr:hypothetical protein [Erythrobacter sp. THAF29]QFT76012.1 hypothetical protein FIU90_00515 [Erythrobacter sp. THAF29]